MNQRSMNIIEEAASQGIWTWLEIANDANSIYLEFKNLKLSDGQIKKESNFKEMQTEKNDNKYDSINNIGEKIKKPDYGDLAIRFGDNTFLSLFYNDVADLDFLNLNQDILNELIYSNKKLNDHFQSFYREFSLKLFENSLKFQSLDYLKDIAKYYAHKKILVENYSDDNKGYDFLLCFQVGEIAIAVGGNNINSFNDFESLNDEDIKKISNNWIIYYLDYWLKKGKEDSYEFDPLCEEIPFSSFVFSM